MAQFDLHELDGQFVVDLQTDLIGLNATRIVAPLRDATQYAAFPDLTPIISFGEKTYVVQVQALAAVSSKSLGRSVGSIRTAQEELFRALDLLTRGF